MSGSIRELTTQALHAAAGRDVYIDGGALTRSALDEDLIDEMIVTLIPAALGTGLPLFAGVHARQSLALINSRAIGGDMVQLTYKPKR